jgi:hypothetical protein
MIRTPSPLMGRNLKLFSQLKRKNLNFPSPLMGEGQGGGDGKAAD